jgi:putative ABC transport system permease protein
MSNWNDIVRERIAVLRLPPERESDIVEEVALHLEAIYDEARADGLSEIEAQTRAVQSYDWPLLEGELSRVEQATVAPWWPPLPNTRGGIRMESFVQDLHFGARMLVKQPGFASIAALTLALGIGANTAIFSVVSAVLFKPLPYAEPERLVALWQTDPRWRISAVSYPDLSDWRARSKSFESLGGFSQGQIRLSGMGPTVRLNHASVTPGLFEMLGARPLVGRTFTDEDAAKKEYVAILSHRLWRERFNADPNAVGRTLTLHGEPYAIIGVMRPGFQFPIEALPVELWTTVLPDDNRGNRFLQVIGRLKPDVPLARARAEMELLAANLAKQYPESNENSGVALVPAHDDLVGDHGREMWLLLAAAGCVLLIACANVANLLLARATVRVREIAVRTTLGATRGRLVRQLLTESLLLSLAGGALGLMLAWWGTSALASMVPEDVPRVAEIAFDRWALAFATLASMATGVVFGVVPAWQASRVEPAEAMKESAGGASASRRRLRLRGALVVAEVAAALTLLVCAGLLIRTLHSYQRIDLGFDPRNVLTAAVGLLDARLLAPAERIEVMNRMMANLRTLPGVTGVATVGPKPLSGNSFGCGTNIEGQVIAPGENAIVNFRAVGGDYFKTMKIALVAGRVFDAREAAASPPVVIVNEAFAKQYFSNQNPIGKRINPTCTVTGDFPWREIVGVVRNVRHRQKLSLDYDPELYVPYEQYPQGGTSLIIRTDGDPRLLVSAIRAKVAEVDAETPLYQIKTFEQFFGVAIAHPKFNALLLGLFAALSLALTAVGLYGVISFAVAQRTQEIGIRIALGAQSGDVVRLVMRQGMKLTLGGLAIGLAASWGATRLMESLLYGVDAADPATLALVVLLLLCVALLACYVPARRATRVDPLTSLRHD